MDFNAEGYQITVAGQLGESEVISPTSRVTHLSSDLLTTACDTFLTTSTAHFWYTWRGNPQ